MCIRRQHRLSLSACTVLACALLWASAASGTEQFWGFETDSGGWTALGCSISRTDTVASEGARSLAVSRKFPGCATIMRPVSLDVNQTPSFSCQVFAPESAGSSLKMLLFLKNKDGLWYQCVRYLPLCPGRWSSVEFDLSPESSEVEPLGHFRRWSNGAAAEMEVIGIKLFSEQAFEAPVLIDAIRIRRGEAQHRPLAITDFRPSAEHVPRFGKFELTFDVNRSFANPFDPAVVEIDAEFTSPSGRKMSVPAFYYQDFVRTGRITEAYHCKLLEDLVPVGRGSWKVRFAPDTAGVYSYVLKVIDHTGAQPQELVTQPRRFTCEQSNAAGYVRVAADTRHFEFGSGAPFYPIGHNVHASNDVSERNCKLLGIDPQDDRGTKAYEDIFRKMAANGENLAEVWMASWSLDIEWTSKWKNYFGLGRYNLNNAWKLDHILSTTEKNGIYIHLVLENHGKISTFVDPEWKDNPFNEENGGFLANCKDYFTRLDARDQYKKKLRYVIARWGYSTTVMGLELWSEIDLTGDVWQDHGQPEFLRAKVDWLRDITQHIRQLDHGRHLLTAHYSGSYQRVQSEIAGLPGIDYIALDAYRKDKSIVPLLEATARALEKFRKPILVTEYGGTPFGSPLPRIEADLHAGIWSAYMMNHAGTPLLWWFTYIDKHDQYRHYKALANFAQGEDRRNRKLKTVRPVVFGPPESAKWAEAIALHDDNSAYVWVYDSRSALEMPPEKAAIELAGFSLLIKGLKRGTYTVELWDTYEGKIIEKFSKAAEAGELLVPLPAFKNDIALKIKRSQDASQ